MNINTDYAQYFEWGITPVKSTYWGVKPSGKDEPIEPSKTEVPAKDETVKSNVINPGWLNKKRAKAKL
jgi:hypothetical protein